MTTTEAARGIGDNMPPSDQEILQERLAERAADLRKRADDLLDAEARAPQPTDDDSAGKLGDYIKMITAAHKAIEAKRVDEKEPFLASGRAVDGFFKKMVEPLEALKARQERRLQEYLRRKRDEERARLQAEAERQAAEARARAAEAARLEAANKPVAAAKQIDEAVRVETAAAEARKAAAAPSAALSRTTGTMGAVAGLRETWRGTITDRDTLDLEALRPYLSDECLQKALNAYVKVHKDKRQIAGAAIALVDAAVVR